MINRNLPPDIRVLGWADVPADFNARFHCIGRKYRYFFSPIGLDVEAMKCAAAKLLGTHDFRNFCRKDPSREITNFTRVIYQSEIVQLDHDTYYYVIHGSAFLYHQVRCTMEILFLVGRSLETTDVIDYLLDVERCTQRPNYGMASEIPLVLAECIYPSTLEWHIDENEQTRLNAEFFALWKDLQVKAHTVNLVRADHNAKAYPFYGIPATSSICPKIEPANK
jgi:tRNA pseudouridine38/39 synthase